MSKRYLKDKLIKEKDIKEEKRLISGSNTDYITPSGKVYTDYGSGLFFPKKSFLNKNNGYLYIGINKSDGGQFQRRLHRIVAETYLPNPDNLPYVLHKDDNKANPNLDNLKWGTASENTKSSYENGLSYNDIGFEDSQSIPVCMFDLNYNLLETFGSVREASRSTKITSSGILYQCNHKVKSKPRCGYYFRYLDEFDENGFVL